MSSNTSLPRATGIVLAGGKSQRMGQNKALITFRGKPLVQHAIEAILPLCVEILIIANDAEAYVRFGMPVFRDEIPDRGSLGGVYTGLVKAGEEFILAVACDMPFLNQNLLRYELSLAHQADVVVPRVKYLSPNESRMVKSRTADDMKRANLDELHPMHAVYSKTCLPVMRERIQAGDLRARSFFDRVLIRIVEPDEVDRFDPLHLSVFNVNTIQDFQTAEELLSEADKKTDYS